MIHRKGDTQHTIQTATAAAAAAAAI